MMSRQAPVTGRGYLPRTRPGGLWRWHLWAGLIGTLILIVAAVSGVLLMYQKELVAWAVTPDARLPSGYGSEAIARQLEVIAERHDSQQMLSVKAPSDIEPYWTLRHEHSLELLALDTLEPYHEGLWLLRLMEFVRELHVELFSGEFGEALLLIGGVLTLFLCVSGLILWWPGRRGFRWRWVIPRKVRPSQWLQYHRHCGAVASPLLLLIVLTGSIMLWQKLVRPILPPPASHTMTSEYQEWPGGSVSEMYLLAQAAVPDGWPTYIRVWSEQGNHQIKARFRLPGEWHLNGRTSVQVNAKTGQMVISERSDQVALSRRLINQLYPLHSGYGMNSLYRLLLVITGVGLIWLVLTGLFHYIKRSKYRRKRASKYAVNSQKRSVIRHSN